MKKLNKLLFTMSLIDKVSAPIGKIQQKLNKMQNLAKAGAKNMALGFAGVAGSLFVLTNAMQPAIAMDRAIGEVRSLGVRDDALKQLTQTALEFSTQYGESATDFVRSSYDIQSSMDGITGRELSGITRSANLFAKATKGDMATATEYFGKMYNIFKRDADKMGRLKWSEQLANESALAVKMFRTTGNEFASAFSQMGATGSAFGVSTAEQFAILGQLQGTLSGSEAGTAYVSFLQGVGQAQKQLGLQFTDSHGRMLPMVDILTALESKFGNLNKLTVAQKDAIKKAFGRKEAVKTIELLSQNVDGLRKNIDSFSSSSGMDNVNSMAESMVDPWQRFKSSVDAVQISFGQALLPVLVPLVDKLSAGAAVVSKWATMFPNLAEAIGTAALAVGGLIALLATYKLAVGAAQLATVAYKAILSTFAAAWWLVNGGLTAYIKKQIKFVRVHLKLFRRGVFRAIAAMKKWRIITLLTNKAMWASPITWVVGIVIALVAGIVYLVKNWEKLKQRFSDNLAFQIVSDSFGWIADKIGAVINAIKSVGKWWSHLMDRFRESAVFTWIVDKITNTINTFKSLFDIIKSAINWWGKWLDKLSNISIFDLLGDAFDGIIDLLNMLPFVDIGGDESAQKLVAKTDQADVDFQEYLQSARESKQIAIAGSGVQKIMQYRQESNSGSRVDQVNVYTDRKIDQEEIEHIVSMAAG